jgi:hypothetical protein
VVHIPFHRFIGHIGHSKQKGSAPRHHATVVLHLNHFLSFLLSFSVPTEEHAVIFSAHALSRRRRRRAP